MCYWFLGVMFVSYVCVDMQIYTYMKLRSNGTTSLVDVTVSYRKNFESQV